IKKRREALSVSQSELAKLVPMTQSQLSLIEAGTNKPQKRTFMAILSCLKQLEKEAAIKSA
ncbi:MAG: helix-turn-helix domain-containing protein, partial [Bdellovibrionota bacterium]